jgi:hypothetical protein
MNRIGAGDRGAAGHLANSHTALGPGQPLRSGLERRNQRAHVVYPAAIVFTQSQE